MKTPTAATSERITPITAEVLARYAASARRSPRGWFHSGR
jgi:hypothetical protein